MPVVKGGVWTNIEDEILKASVSKYGLNQWARVSSLLARKTPKQCKARWSEWLDPGIRKIEWSKEEDEKLLHLAKLMPTQWRTIAPIVGRTATQCLERYQKLLDEAESRENDELGLGGPDGGENKAPSADDVRRLRPGELDPDPEAKPARPDTIDLDEDEKEMLSEARARLANTQGKKAKRKARERQLEESRRLASLQKRRELKSAGINIKITTRKTGQMDYNADIPFEKAPAPGFYDTQDELQRNERQREFFDPAKQQLANKRKNDEQEAETDDRKRRKNDKSGPSAASVAAQKAGQMQKIREAERSSKRKSLVLPAPQVGEGELEDIVKMGMIGERSAQSAGYSDNDATRGLLAQQSGIVGSTPIRTPRAPQEEDRVANEIRNARLRTETQSALLGGENADLHEGDGTTGYDGVAPSKQQAATPNPLATPLRQQMNGVVGATPMRTPRDSFRLNEQTPFQAPGQTPREIKLAQHAARNSLKGRLAALPKPKESEFEFDIPDEQDETSPETLAKCEEDAAIRDARNAGIAAAAAQAELRRQTQVLQRGLPRPRTVDCDALMEEAAALDDPSVVAIAEEAARLVVFDAKKLGGALIKESAQGLQPLERYSDDALERARMEVALELSMSKTQQDEAGLHPQVTLTAEYSMLEDPSREDDYPGLFEAAEERLTRTATDANAVEKKLAKLLGGYQARGKMLRQKMVEASETLAKTNNDIETGHVALANEEAAIGSRLEKLRDEVQQVVVRERTAQDAYREAKAELDGLMSAQINGYH